MMTTVTILVWTLTVLLILVGFVGVLVPLLPGTTLIFVAVVLHKLLLPASISWAMVGWIALLWLLSLALDVVGVMIGTRLGGGTKWGMAGASGGAVIGSFVSLPALILGTMLGAVLAERLAHKRDLRETLRAGVGAGLGFFLGFLGRLLCAVTMIGFFVLANLRG
jgi:uncharacterized protein YqgC (DUF456 family)